MSAAIWIAAAVIWLPLGSAERFGSPGLQASKYLGCLTCIPLQLVLTTVAVEKSVAQMLKLHLSFMKVSVAVVAGADDCILQHGFECD